MNASVVLLVAKQHPLYLMRSRKSQYFQCFVVDYVLILHPFCEGGTVEERRESGNPPARAARSPASRSPAGGRRRGTTRDRAPGHGKGGARRARGGRHAARAGDDVAGFGFASTLPGGGAEFGARGSGLGVRGSGLGVRGSEFGVRSSEFGVRGSEFGVRSSEFGARSSELGARSSELGVRSSEFGARSSELGTRSRCVGRERGVSSAGWGGVGRGAARGRSAPRSAAVNGAMRRYLAVPGGIGWYSAMSAGRPGAPRRDAYSTPVRRAPARHSSISRTFTRLPLILPALSLRSASRAMPRSTAT
ncbi:exodeoxyribonuclease V subunit gamma [Burkholderia pseudomallei]|nr:exodeoxyribonuclease V subunit gamma [Burkholderia pseudomallei]VCK80806.1 exodeoxyribonuclease V subunit gamma [Burkholderia pseudomallei]VCK81089.1 exodeoxyribonuclease V subunit gamma [Burkholderia pseudomallei]VCK83148.1 exodeoxyribonuclease V subunit gamma [Burkholderia pseudomallei]VCK84414.1 exodeoxyribonuclease V subunit gamma [Burkholderia pseudomallei]